MSDKKDDSNELDSYGVWVKNSPLDINDDTLDSSENSIGEFDLPDFGEPSDGEDIFKDLDFTSTAEDLQEESLDDGETSLNPDELANIVMEADTQISEEEPAQSEGITDEETAALSGAFFSDDLDLPEEEPFDDEDFAKNINENFDDGEIEPAQIDATEEIQIEQEMSDAPASEETEISFDDGEIDLDAFMGDSGDSQEISFDDGEIDLGDFMGGDFSSSAPSKEPAEIKDEQTLDIDVGFDEEAEAIAVEDTPENEAAMNPVAPQNVPNAQGGTDDEMFSSFDAAVAAQGIPESLPEGGADSSISSSSDEIDLSEFGFDDDDSKIGITDGPDGSNPIKKEVINYVMKVTADDDTDTPSVKDVINGKISAEFAENDSEEDYTTNTMENTTSNAVSPEISEKGKEILEQIMAELSSLRSEIKNIKTEFADIQSRPPAPAAQDIPQAASEQDEDSEGFFGSDDGDNTIALSGSEMTDILNSAEITQSEEESEDFAEPEATIESDSMEEPQIEENAEQEIEENAISEDELGIPDPTLEGLSDDFTAPTQISDEMNLEESALPEEISVPTLESFNDEALNEYMSEDTPIENSLTEDNLSYLAEDSAIKENDSESETQDQIPNVDEIMQDNISLQEGEEASVGIDDDINAAFEEADAIESDIIDDSLAAKDNFENSVSGIMQENISNQEGEEASIEIDDDIDAAFEEADAIESDIIDDSLAAKDAYEQEINKNIDGENEEPLEFEEPVIEESLPDEIAAAEPAVTEPLPEDADETALEETEIPALEEDSLAMTEQASPTDENYEQETDKNIDGENEEPLEFEEPVIGECIPDETAIEEPTVAEPLSEDSLEETSVEEPTIEETFPDENFEEPIPAETAETKVAQTQQNSIPKNLREEVISVLSYMDQLLENLPEEKITEFAKSEHFVTYKKLFDELGLS